MEKKSHGFITLLRKISEIFFCNNRRVSIYSLGILFLLLALGEIFFFDTTHADSSLPVSNVVISELAWSGSEISPYDEWLELYNQTKSVIDLSGWRLTKFSHKNETEMLVIASGQIAPAGHFLISNYSPSDNPSKTNLQFADFSSSKLSLSNSTLQIKLYDIQGNLVDTAGNQSNPPAGDKANHCSMERVNPLESGQLSTSWQTATTSEGFSFGAVGCGSPQFSAKPRIVNFSANFSLSDNRLSLSIETFDYNFDSLLANVSADNLFPAQEFTLHSSSELRVIKLEGVPAEGLYILRLAVYDSDGLSDSANYELNIFGKNELVINEILPKPLEGKKEWIELYNPSDHSHNISNWYLDDSEGGTSLFLLPSGTVIKSNDYLVFKKQTTGIGLNDSTDQARLLYPSKEVAFATPYYHNAKSGESWQLNSDSSWSWSPKPTPHALNYVSQPVEESSRDEKSSNKPDSQHESQTPLPPSTNNQPSQSTNKSPSEPNIQIIKEIKLYEIRKAVAIGQVNFYPKSYQRKVKGAVASSTESIIPNSFKLFFWGWFSCVILFSCVRKTGKRFR